MSFIDTFADKVGDTIGSSKFAQDRQLVKRFTGGVITREDYETYKVNGRVDEIFGHVENANPHKMYFGLTPSYGYDDAKHVRDFMLAFDVLSFLNEAGVTIDLDDPKNARTKEILLEGIHSFSLKNDRAPVLFEPYNQHSEVRAAIDECNRLAGHTDGPVYNPRTATKDQIDEMGDHGIGF